MALCVSLSDRHAGLGAVVAPPSLDHAHVLAGFRGVYRYLSGSTAGWSAQISIQSFNYYLGAFPTVLQAARAWDLYYVCCDLHGMCGQQPASQRDTHLPRACYGACEPYLRQIEPEALRVRFVEMGATAMQQHQSKLQQQLQSLRAQVLSLQRAAKLAVFSAAAGSSNHMTALLDSGPYVSAGSDGSSYPDVSLSVRVRAAGPSAAAAAAASADVGSAAPSAAAAAAASAAASLEVGTAAGEAAAGAAADLTVGQLSTPQLQAICQLEGLPATGTQQQLAARVAVVRPSAPAAAAAAAASQAAAEYKQFCRHKQQVRSAEAAAYQVLEQHLQQHGTDRLLLNDSGQDGTMRVQGFEQVLQQQGYFCSDMQLAFVVPPAQGGARHTDNVLFACSAECQQLLQQQLPPKLFVPMMAALAGPTKAVKALAVSSLHGNEQGQRWQGPELPELMTVGHALLDLVRRQSRRAGSAAAAAAAEAPVSLTDADKQEASRLLEQWPCQTTADLRVAMQQAAACSLIEQDQDVCHLVAASSGGPNTAANMVGAQSRTWNRAIGAHADAFLAFWVGLAKTRRAHLVRAFTGTQQWDPDAHEAAVSEGRQVVQALLTALAGAAVPGTAVSVAAVLQELLLQQQPLQPQLEQQPAAAVADGALELESAAAAAAAGAPVPAAAAAAGGSQQSTPSRSRSNSAPRQRLSPAEEVQLLLGEFKALAAAQAAAAAAAMGYEPQGIVWDVSAFAAACSAAGLQPLPGVCVGDSSVRHSTWEEYAAAAARQPHGLLPQTSVALPAVVHSAHPDVFIAFVQQLGQWYVEREQQAGEQQQQQQEEGGEQQQQEEGSEQQQQQPLPPQPLLPQLELESMLCCALGFGEWSWGVELLDEGEVAQPAHTRAGEELQMMRLFLFLFPVPGVFRLFLGWREQQLSQPPAAGSASQVQLAAPVMRPAELLQQLASLKEPAS